MVDQPTSAGHWVCQVCHNPTGGAGVIEIINRNIDLGPIGSYPQRASENASDAEARYLDTLAADRGIPREELVSLSMAELMDMPDPEINIEFVCRHLHCTADQHNEGYWFETARAATPPAWMAWILHVAEKPWMGRDDIVRMAAFWWAHKGDAPPQV